MSPPAAVGSALGLLGGEVYALAVQREGEGLHALSRGVVPEDPLHDRRLRRVDLEPGRSRVLCAPTGCLHRGRPVAKDAAAGTQAPGGAAGEPAVGLVPEVVQVQFIHEALDREMDFPTLLAAGDAIAHPHDVDALEPQAMVEAEEFAGVPRQAG